MPTTNTRPRVLALIVLAAVACTALFASRLLADGKMVAPADYKGSVEERAQEAIIIFHASDEPGGATEDMILKVSVVGEVESFAWIVPFPNEPTVEEEDAQLFRELFDYVEARQVRRGWGNDSKPEGAKAAETPAKAAVEVLSNKVVGSYRVAVVRENTAGALNGWLEENGYQTLDDADDVLSFYREKGYVFACIRVDEAQLDAEEPVDLHPLRFSFKTGGRDGIYFPMKMTGLQETPFDVNLYIFYGKWINDNLSKFGYEHRGFVRKYRDWDTPRCESNAGKSYSAPEDDPLLGSLAHKIPTIAKFFQKLHPGERYYLTNIQARRLRPKAVRQWADDLWVFPYYTDPDFIPYDARPDGPAHAAWPDEDDSAAADAFSWPMVTLFAGVVGVLLGAVGGLGIALWVRKRTTGQDPPPQ